MVQIHSKYDHRILTQRTAGSLCMMWCVLLDVGNGMRWCTKALPQGMNFWVLSFVGLTYMASRFVGEILILMHLYSVFVSLLSSNQMQGVYACIRNSELVLGNLSMLTFTVKEVLLSNRITSWSHLSTIATSSNFLGAFIGCWSMITWSTVLLITLYFLNKEIFVKILLSDEQNLCIC